HREAVTWQEARLVLRAPAHTVRDTSAPAGGHHATARPYEPHYLGELGGVQLPWRVEHQEDGRCRPPPPPPRPPPPPPPPPLRSPALAIAHEIEQRRAPPRHGDVQPRQHVVRRAAPQGTGEQAGGTEIEFGTLAAPAPRDHGHAHRERECQG